MSNLSSRSLTRLPILPLPIIQIIVVLFVSLPRTPEANATITVTYQGVAGQRNVVDESGSVLANGNAVRIGTFVDGFVVAGNVGDPAALNANWVPFDSTVIQVVQGQHGRFTKTVTGTDSAFDGKKIYLWIFDTCDCDEYGLFSSSALNWVFPAVDGPPVLNTRLINSDEVDEVFYGTIETISLKLTAFNNPNNFCVEETAADDAVVGTVILTGNGSGMNLVYSISAGNANGAFEVDNNGVIQVANTAMIDFETLQNYMLTIEVVNNDTSSLFEIVTVTIFVKDIDEPPTVITSIANQETLPGQAFNLDISSHFDDPEGGMLTFSAVGLPVGVTISNGGVISGSANSHDVTTSPHTVTVTVMDPAGLFVDTSFQLKVVCNVDVECPDNRVLTLDDQCEVILPDLTSMATVTDNCDTDAPITRTQTPLAGFMLSFGQSVSVVISVIDSLGNTSTCSTIVTARDESDPDIMTCAAARTVTLDSGGEAMIPDLTSSVTVTDNCDTGIFDGITQEPAVEFTLTSAQTIVVKLTATDDVGNSSLCTTMIRVKDPGAQDHTVILSKGWNLISIPTCTTDTAADLLGNVGSGAIWRWRQDRLERVSPDDILESAVGYWFYATVDAGIPLTNPFACTPNSGLAEGFNLFGPLGPVTNPYNANIIGRIWFWEGNQLHPVPDNNQGGQLNVGRGYIIFSANDQPYP